MFDDVLPSAGFFGLGLALGEAALRFGATGVASSVSESESSSGDSASPSLYLFTQGKANISKLAVRRNYRTYKQNSCKTWV